MIRQKRSWALLFSLFMLTSLFPYYGQAQAEALPQAGFGQVLDTRQMEIGPGAYYTWQDRQLAQGLEKIHYVEFDPKNPMLDLQPGTTNGKVYGMEGVSKMANDADRAGNRVIAAINADFYDMTTGVPIGIFMGDGVILTSPPDDWQAFGLNEDGTTIYGSSPKLTRTVSIGGKELPLSSINRMRFNDEALILYSYDFHTSTMTNDLGDEVVLDVLSGEVKSGSTLQLKVAEIHKNKGNSPIKQGQVVLSASGKYRTELAGLQVGDELSASFQFEEKWKNVKMAVGGTPILVEGGVVLQHEDPALYPRVGIGTKADGSIVMIEIDGRAPGFSEGVTFKDLGNIMKDIGVVDGITLDGGGSATFVAKLPGEPLRKILNRPSDGGERKTANGILLVNKAPEGAASKLVVQPNMERVLAGSSYTFKSTAVDANGHPAIFAETPAWSVNVDPAVGTIDAAGRFVAGDNAGMADITVSAGGLTGSGQVEVVSELTELKFPDAVRTFTSGASVPMSITALRNGQVIQADNSKFEWRVEGPIGSIDADGVFTATGETEKSGQIFVKYGNIEASMNVNIGLPPVILEDFENGVGNYKETSGARFNTVKVSEETDEDLVRFGTKSAKLEYDFKETIGISGAYIEAVDADHRIQVPGYPEKISVWVYGDGKGHWLRGQLRDGNNAAVAIDFVTESESVQFKGWKYLEADVPKGRPLPFTMDMPIRYMETKNDNKTDGVLYIDQIRALYGPVQDDMDPPVLKNFTPVEGSVIHTNIPLIQAFGEDFGYDPAVHPGTTLIDPDKIRLYVDEVEVHATLYPPKGQIHYTPEVPLTDGVHMARLKIRDLAGNQTEKAWTFTVDTGSSKIVYDNPSEVYAGGTYALNVRAIKASDIKDGHIAFTFDPAKVEDLQVIKGAKLADSQLQPTIDAATGNVRLDFNGINTTSLADEDSLAQIQYRVKDNAAGTVQTRFTSGALKFTTTEDMSVGFFGLPVEAVVKNQMQLSWNEFGVVQGYTTTFKVVDESGLPVEGAKIMEKSGTEIGATNAEGILENSILTGELRQYELQAVKGQWLSPVLKFTVSKLAGSPIPSNISVTMGEDTTKSRAFTWHTNPGTDTTVVEVAPASEFTDFTAANVLKFEGSSYLFNTWDIGTVKVHKAVADGLAPGTKYVFRVGDGNGNYSTNGSFQTAAATGERTKFIFLGDSQASNEAGFKLWGDVLNKAIADHPDTEFVVQGGDLVEDGFKENEWNMWFNASKDVLMNTTVVPVVGNHEVTGTRKTEDYLAHFNHPQNGIDSLKGSNFSFDYKNAHFVVLNSEYDFEEQKEWLRQDLAATDKKWKLIAFHRGPYGSMYDSEHIRSVWTPIFDEFKVDVVMNGHDHVYLRTYPMKDQVPVAEGEGTTYIVGGSAGPKFYAITERSWQKVTDAEQVQMYVAVEIDGDEMKFVVKTVKDRIVDQFTLKKVNNPEEVQVDKVELDRTAAELKVGEQLQLNATVLPANASDKTVIWSVLDSSPSNVATVSSNGLVSAVNPGTAKIRATSKANAAQYAEMTLTVKASSSGGYYPPVVNPIEPPVTEKPDPTDPKVENGTITAPAVLDAAGTLASAAISADDIELAFKDAKDNGAGIKTVRIDIAGGQTAGRYEVSLPAQALNGSAADQKLEIATNLGVVTLPSNFLSDAEAKKAKMISLVIEKVDPSSLSGTLRSQIGNHPVIGLSIMVDGVQQAWSNPDAPVQVSIPYKPTTAELNNPNGLVIWYLDDAGQATVVLNGQYDPAAGAVRFTVDHFSSYAVVYANKTFTDLTSYAWAKGAVESLAARGIIKGTDNDRFSPALEITRADFVTLLVRALGLEETAEGSFADVRPADYYYGAVGTAKKLGLVIGTDQNAFHPKAKISRQEMFLIVSRALQQVKKVELAGNRDVLDAFQDGDQVAEYAADSMAGMINAGLIQGNGGKLNPTGQATRADVAVFIERILNELYK
ncbi:phosphodiester glycosidase family protein [Paenibacillus mendelii]|uniref:Phosphodiester glycosidase family protein n=1 Tax=Paenibacillus mendelii TaxID=206163 RepID=A0ABV6J2U0_9BACL|nr:phosphodiester glycosidase family protein [Paenibacillus mendelii]MCQ6559304.1 phosphodiester glycosidase family protein [Paenibacillus mendelii]